MRRQPISFEWQVAEDDEDWQQLTLGPATLSGEHRPPNNVDRRVLLYLLRGIAICVASIALVAGVGLTPEEDKRLQAIAGISAVLAEEVQANGLIAAANTATLPNAQTAAQVGQGADARATATQVAGIGLLRVEQVGDITLAEILITRPLSDQRLSSPYRVTRFYRETENGWQPTRPDRVFWGRRVQRATTHLHFTFFARDAAAIEPILDRVETLYVALHKLFGLELPSTRSKLTIEITPEPVSSYEMADNYLRVPSPLMAQIPSHWSASTFLHHQIVGRMLAEVISSNATLSMVGLSNKESFAFRWRPMWRGLRGWLEKELLADVDPMHQQQAAQFLRLHNAQRPLTLDDIWWGNQQPLSDEERRLWQDMAAESVIAYTVKTYGPDRLPALLYGFHQFGNWQTFVLGAFGASVDEFEAGWNQYLAEQADPPANRID